MVWKVGIVRVLSPAEKLWWRHVKGVVSLGRRKIAAAFQELVNFVNRAKGQTHRSEGGVCSEPSGNGAISGDEEVGEVPDLRVEVGYSRFNVTAKNKFLRRVDISFHRQNMVIFSYPSPRRVVPPRWRANPGLLADGQNFDFAPIARPTS